MNVIAEMFQLKSFSDVQLSYGIAEENCSWFKWSRFTMDLENDNCSDANKTKFVYIVCTVLILY